MGEEEKKQKEGIEKEIKWFVLTKMVRHRFWGHKHTSIHNLPKGLPDRLRSRKEVRNAIDDLVKEFLIKKPTNYGLEVSLRVDKKREIEDFVLWGIQKCQEPATKVAGVTKAGS